MAFTRGQPKQVVVVELELPQLLNGILNAWRRARAQSVFFFFF